MRTGTVGFWGRLVVLAFLTFCVAGCPNQSPDPGFISHFFSR